MAFMMSVGFMMNGWPHLENPAMTQCRPINISIISDNQNAQSMCLLLCHSRYNSAPVLVPLVTNTILTKKEIKTPNTQELLSKQKCAELCSLKVCTWLEIVTYMYSQYEWTETVELLS